MTPNDEFTPDTVDERIEQLFQVANQQIHTTDQDDVSLVQVLRHIHRVPLSATDRDSLQRARQRIVGGRTGVDTRDHEMTPSGQWDASGSMWSNAAHRKKSTTVRALSALAAAIIVGVLVGSWILVTHMVVTQQATRATGLEDLYIAHQHVMYRLDGRTGKVLWRHPVPTRKQPDPRMGSSAYVQVVNHVVYVVLDFDIYALKASNGQQLWHVTNPSQYSYFSVVVDNGLVYLFSVDNTFSALNAADGSTKWHNTTFKTENGYGFTVQNGTLYTQGSVTASGPAGNVYALDAATGAVRWHFPLSRGSMISPPVVAGGIAYIISGDRLYGLNEQNGHEIWEQGPPGVRSSFFSGKVANGVLYMDEGSIIMESSTDVRKVHAFDARTGSPLWVSDPGYQMYDLPLTDGLLLAAREHNGVYSVNGLDPRTGKPAWQVPFNCPIEHFGPWLYPQCDAAWTGIVDGTLYLVEHENRVQQATPPRSDTGQSNIYTLKAFDARTGKLLAQHALDIKSDSPGPIGTSNGLLYFMISIPRQANTITYADYAFDAFRLSDGGHIWHYPLPPFQPPTGQASYPTTSQSILAP